uniref:HAT C-terminal dimerisation domain-containing protein n=1 Tax=Chenopodium quinoa TaxID=63459 RepID=A0A803LF35_CHEQI
MMGDNNDLDCGYDSSCPSSTTASPTPPPIIPPPPPRQPNNPSQSVYMSSQPDKSETSTRKERKHTSMFWDHFQTKTINGMPKAKCLHCDHILSAITKNGTPHLKDQINLRCTRKNSKVDIRQKLLSVNCKSDGSTRVENDNFSQEVSRRELVNMVIMHEYPLSIVDHINFRFVTSLNAHFKIISRYTLRVDIMKMFMSEKTGLKKALESNGLRIAITIDMWTASNQRKGYMAVTCHYIDEFWVFHNKMLRFAYVPCPHTKDTLAQVLLDTLNMYNIAEKVSSIVVDKCTTNDAMLDVLSPRFNEQSLMLKGKFLHLRCSAHILNLIVQDGLDVIGDGINVIVFTSGQQLQNELKCLRIRKGEEGIKLVLDCKTRWNSTFVMLTSALRYEDVFSNIKRQNPRLKFILPTEMDWKFAEKSEGFDILKFLHIELKYPTLQKIAKDILAIPASIVASRSAFSMGGKVIGPHRSRLHANTVEALMCLQNWIQGEYSGYDEGLALENAQACATILEDDDSLDMSSNGSEVVDLD